MEAGFSMGDVWSVSAQQFNELALDLFHFQSKNNAVYAQFLALIDKSPERVSKVEEIPYLPIAFFKTHEVRSAPFSPQAVFESSSTTGTGVSLHSIRSLEDYHRNCLRIFEQQFGPVADKQILALLPNYLERPSSSLVSMVRHLQSQGVHPEREGFFLYDHDGLRRALVAAENPILFGVSFALLDLLETGRIDTELLLIETGGMKGRRGELSRSELNERLKAGFPNARIHSEYGMTELMSQAYTDADGRYRPPAWMRVSCRLDTDPLSQPLGPARGALNIIDLANIHSCSFIATEDLGRIHPDGRFDVLGRLDQADLRGCSLMIPENPNHHEY